jgi:UDP-N-acetylglucosamine 2-epimerase (non-hydrolysing)
MIPKRKKIIFVVGARPNFMKMAPILNCFKQKKDLFETITVHTGQHYDDNMSSNILSDLDFPEPDYFLNVGGGTHAKQTSQVMIKFEDICLNICPSIVVLAGDVNSTLACAIVASKLHVKIAHIESGLRSFDRKMPEEINRIIVDSISDLLFTTESSGNSNLLKEGISTSKIYFVGNTMIDSLVKYIPKAQKMKPWIKYGFSGNDYILLTLHRPSNVDNETNLKNLFSELLKISSLSPIIFVIHPRTKSNILKYDIKLPENIILVDPLPYIEFLGLMSKAKFVLTDSGGMQEETTVLNVPCLTLRDNTERPVTVEQGTNTLIGKVSNNISKKIIEIIEKPKKLNTIPLFWDGKSSERIAKTIQEYLLQEFKNIKLK